MRKNFSGVFMVVSILLMYLHTLRGWEPAFVVGGRLPYILYYGTIGLFIICLMLYGYDVVKNLYDKIKNSRK